MKSLSQRPAMSCGRRIAASPSPIGALDASERQAAKRPQRSKANFERGAARQHTCKAFERPYRTKDSLLGGEASFRKLHRGESLATPGA